MLDEKAHHSALFVLCESWPLRVQANARRYDVGAGNRQVEPGPLGRPRRRIIIIAVAFTVAVIVFLVFVRVIHIGVRVFVVIGDISVVGRVGLRMRLRERACTRYCGARMCERVKL